VGLTVEQLEIADPAEPWRHAGFTVGGDVAAVGGVRLLLRGRADGKVGIRSWTLGGAPGDGSIDGMPTRAGDLGPATPGEHPNGAVLIDHAVLATPDVDRTVGRLREWGLEPRRERRTGTYGAPMRQVFFRLGEVILELIGPGEVDEARSGRPARFFGLAFTVRDLDATKALLGDALGTPKAAVQPGRRIATLRHRDLGLSTAVAFMSPGSQEPA
jgi:hypothetical protein